MRYIDETLARQLLPRRPRSGHKGSFGSLDILAGSAAYRGAAALAVGGALRAGAGLVRLASTERVCAAVAALHPGCIFMPLAEAPNGGIDPACAQIVLDAAPSARLAGCGMGASPATAALVEALLRRGGQAMVLDADALNALAGHTGAEKDEDLRSRMFELARAYAAPLVLTPHIGEMARLCGQTPEQVQQHQPEVAQQLAGQLGCVIVLKSHHTVVAEPEGGLWMQQAAGNPGMAKGGSGDVLAGIIASLLAQGMQAHEAAIAGVWLHAAAGDEAAAQYGEAGLLPEDMPRCLALVWQRLGL